MDALGSGGASVVSFWQVCGALLTVLGLLVVALKFLSRFQRQPGADSTRILRVRRLGPRRELEVLQVDDQVYTLYRHDGGLAVLKCEAAATYRAREDDDAVAPTATQIGRKLRAMAAAAGGGARPSVP